MKFTVLCGSSRRQSQSDKVARYIERELTQKTGAETYYLSLAGNPLPIWDESVFANAELWQNVWNPIKSELQSSDGFVFVVPEWNGMAPSAVINFFQLCSAQELAHKPGLLVAISASRGGAYPIAELRMASYKNSRLCYLPEHLIIRDVEKMLNGVEASSEEDAYIRSRCAYSLNLLVEYTKALAQVRKSAVIDHKAFPNGMS